MNQKKNIDNKGFSLVEVLVSIVILSFILTAILLIFIQSAKTTRTSENMIDATYIAQTEVDSIYAFSLRTKYSVREAKIEELGYTKKIVNNNFIFEKTAPDSSFVIRIRLKDYSGKSNVTYLIVEVYQTKDGTLRAKMEDILVWGGN